MKYSLKKIAIITEIIGGIAIIVSLIFVGFQFRENTIATKSATANSANGMTVDWYTATGNSAQSSQLMWDYLKDPKSIKSTGEIYQATILIHGLILSFQNSYYLTNQGTLDQNVQESLTAAIRAVKEQPGWQEYWQNRKSLFFVEFRDYVDLIMNSESEVSEGIYENLKKEETEANISD
ncbi:hypothetical protein [Muriicola soli]|uniref:DUF4760 domain-containing protein n=1 Tax=Muriicola soli TaxID=2507538 RepID=A0A411E932_9FLAO|nr:hypothetical protein [Muriicola soli]QBA63970.1 hypothetical protein EQY75_05110 [Muriicola soli]